MWDFSYEEALGELYESFREHDYLEAAISACPQEYLTEQDLMDAMETIQKHTEYPLGFLCVASVLLLERDDVQPMSDYLKDIRLVYQN